MRTLAALLLTLAGTGSAAAQAIDSLTLGADARALAHDSLLGRATGSAGERAAAAYIAARLEAIGLDPVHPAGYRVPLPLLRARLADESRIRIATGGDTAVFMAGRDFVIATGSRRALRAFAGPAVHVSEADVDAARLAGSVVLTDDASADGARRLRAWARAGVEAVILPAFDPALFARLRERGDDRLVVSGDVDEPVWQPDVPVLYADTPLIRALVVDGTVAARDRGIRDLRRHVAGDLVFDTTSVPSANVAALLPGSDPALRDEIVVVTAHYDHLGVGPAVAGDSIYNGFSDNAAGVAMALAIAGALRADPPARSTLFLFPSGEERGLLGAAHWAAHPPPGPGRIVAVLNLDAGAPPAPPVRWRVAGDTAASAVRTAARIVEAHGWTADRTDASANSDHWPFQDRGIPTVFLVPGREWQGLDAEQGDRLFRRWDRYHHPGDQWRPGFPLAGLQRYAGLALDIVRALGASEGR